MVRANGPKKDQFSVLATAIWFEEIRRFTHDPTYYAIEQMFEPEAFGKSYDGEPYHRNKWAKYAVGLHQPSKKMVKRVDQKIPWASKLLYHPIWEILRDIEAVRSKKESWLRRLDLNIQNVVTNNQTPWNANGHKLNRPLNRQLRMLENRASIDATACVAILAAEAISDRNDDAIHIASSLYRVLLITCTEMPFIKFRNEIFNCMCERIFNRIQSEEIRLGVDYVDFSEEIYLLIGLKESLQRNGKAPSTSSGGVKACAGLLNGDFGYDAMFALNLPQLKRVKSAGVYKIDYRPLILKDWGLSVLCSGGYEKFPPNNLCDR